MAFKPKPVVKSTPKEYFSRYLLAGVEEAEFGLHLEGMVRLAGKAVAAWEFEPQLLRRK